MYQKLHDRLMAGARERAARTHTPFNQCLDALAVEYGYDDWSHFRTGADAEPTLRNQIAHMGRVLSGSRSGPNFGMVATIALKVHDGTIARIPNRPDPKATGRLAFLTAMTTSTAACISFLAVAVSRYGEVRVGAPAMMTACCIYMLFVLGRDWIAADSDPGHGGVPALFEFPLYFLSFSIGLGMLSMLQSGTLQYESPVMSTLRMIGGLCFSASSVAWCVAIIAMFLRHRKNAR